MHSFKLFTILMAGSAFAATRPKANEYKSGDCSGSINFGHNRFSLGDVTMDDTSHSVYLTSGQSAGGLNNGPWYGYSGKTKNGGTCIGTNLGKMVNGCHNLDHPAGLSPGRVKCVSFRK